MNSRAFCDTVGLVELEHILRFLSEPASYPHRPPRVEVVQTHISAIFLAGHLVYKVKKPVNLGFLDFTTLERRRHFCQEEVRLNRRLCPEVYLGVEVIGRTNGALSLGRGEPVEYAVVMRRLPQDRMMDALLARGELTPRMVEDVAACLADFHERAATDERIAAFGRPEAIRVNTDENFAQTERYRGRLLSPQQFSDIRRFTEAFLERRELFEERIRRGRVRDGHGDLHLQHICLADRIYIFDCIEFNERFRYGDVAVDLAFLLMDLDFHDRPDLARLLERRYQELSGDRALGEMLPFYKCYRAYVRGKVEGFRSEDPRVPPEQRREAQERARRYFQLAHRYALAGGA